MTSPCSVRFIFIGLPSKGSKRHGRNELGREIVKLCGKLTVTKSVLFRRQSNLGRPPNRIPPGGNLGDVNERRHRRTGNQACVGILCQPARRGPSIGGLLSKYGWVARL